MATRTTYRLIAPPSPQPRRPASRSSSITRLSRSPLSSGFAPALEASGANIDELGIPDDFGTPDELVTTEVDVSAFVERKREALAAHGSQAENFFFSHLPDEVVTLALSYESFTLRSAQAGLARENDLFAGLR